jgi:hypothetical protein
VNSRVAFISRDYSRLSYDCKATPSLSNSGHGHTGANQALTGGRTSKSANNILVISDNSYTSQIPRKRKYLAFSREDDLWYLTDARYIIDVEEARTTLPEIRLS